MRTFARVAAIVAVTLTSVVALADKVANLPSRGAAPMNDKVAIHNAAETGSKALGHTTISETEIVQGEAAAGDKAGTSAGMIAIGKTTGADWVVEPTVASNEYGTHVELKVCQVATGRIETLARDLDPKTDATTQITEMLLLMLRPQGVGDDPLPWQKKAATPEKPPAAVLPKPKPKPVTPPLLWGEGGKISLGAAAGIGSVVVRHERATGSPRFYAWTLHGNVAIPSVKGLEVTVRFGGVLGPGNGLGGDLGARYMLSGPSLGILAIGLGANLGGFGAFQSGIAGLSLGLDPTLSLAIAKPVQIDLAWKNRYVPNESPLLFTSAELALLARF